MYIMRSHSYKVHNLKKRKTLKLQGYSVDNFLSNDVLLMYVYVRIHVFLIKHVLCQTAFQRESQKFHFSGTLNQM